MSVRSLHRGLAAVALAVAAFAVLGGEPRPIASPVGALELAQRIRAREPGLMVVDARGEEYDPASAVPGAVAVSPETPARWPVETAQFLVVYSADEAGSVRVWRRARRAWPMSVTWLEGGIDEWTRRIMVPVLPAPVTARDSARDREIREISLYFGGSPRRALPGEKLDAEDPATLMQRARRRGCGL